MKFLRRLPWRVKAVGIGGIVFAASVLCFLTFVALDSWFPFPSSSLERPSARIVVDRTGQPIRMFLPSDGRWRWPVRLNEINPALVRALIESEDRWFRFHPGVDPLAVVRATWLNLRLGRVVSGASTIPMQIARMSDPRRRTITAKLVEAFRALQLVWNFEGDELLEAYLNLAPYGGNLEGVGAASYFYFGKTPAQLSPGEIALLTALPRSPSQYEPVRNPQSARKIRDRVLRQLLDSGVFNDRDVQDALLMDVPRRRREAPFLAPHFARFMLKNAPQQSRIGSTLDARVQLVAQSQVSARIDELRRRGIQNAAVVVIENATRSVRAMVGSAGFFESEFGGQINGASIARSPGSTLKPLLFALAFDTGEIVPESYLLDIPSDFSGYVADNYDGRYRGRVTASSALEQSLNASSVRLLSRIGLGPFHKLLRKGGLETLDRSPIHYGLPLILGSGEVRLLDLTNLYATLAREGLHSPFQFNESKPLRESRIFSREASHWVTRILMNVRRPDFPETWTLARGLPEVAWKTGTSYGHRDAWAVGYSQRYSIGVWVGNFDARGQKGISGARDAGPLLFDLFGALEPDGARIPTPKALEIGSIQLCTLSRQLPGPFCRQRSKFEYLPGRSNFTQCSIHQRIFVAKEDGLRLSGSCLSARPYDTRVVAQWPAELIAFRRAQGEIVENLPQLSQSCTDVLAASGPRIESPDPSTPYHLRRDTPLGFQKIALSVAAGSGVRRIYWYRDGVLVRDAAPGDPVFVRPEIGTHRLVAVDDAGRSDVVTYKVVASSSPER